METPQPAPQTSRERPWVVVLALAVPAFVLFAILSGVFGLMID